MSSLINTSEDQLLWRESVLESPSFPKILYRVQYQGWRACRTQYNPSVGFVPRQPTPVDDLAHLAEIHGTWYRYGRAIDTPFVASFGDAAHAMRWANQDWLADFDKRVFIIDTSRLNLDRLVNAESLYCNMGEGIQMANTRGFFGPNAVSNAFGDDWLYLGNLPREAIAAVTAHNDMNIRYSKDDIWGAPIVPATSNVVEAHL